MLEIIVSAKCILDIPFALGAPSAQKFYSAIKLMKALPTVSRLTRMLSSVVLLGTVGAACFAASRAVQNRASQNAAPNGAVQERNANDGEVHVLHVHGKVSMLAGAGGNITVQAGDEGILLVDTGMAGMSEKVIAAIRPLSNKPLTYIINTDERDDHIGGNENVGKIGRPLSRNMGVDIISFVTVLDRMSAPTGQTAPTPEGAWPNDTYSGAQKNLHFNDETVQVFHQPGTTDGNSIVLFRGSDVISTGDIFDPTEYPIIDLKSGGSLQGVLEGLNRLKRMVVPANHMEGGTMVIPGHGRLCEAADVAIYQQMVTIVRDRIQYMIKNGMTLEQVIEAKPTQDYDPVYGRTAGNWTTNMFIEAAYKSLSAKQQPRATSRGN
jgi:cyclase